MARILDGIKIAARMEESIAEEVRLLGPSSRAPVLASVISEESEDARIYVNMQMKAASRAGIGFRQVKLPADMCERDMIEEISRLNADPGVSSIILQKPLPGGLDHGHMVRYVHPDKDAEGLHPCNLGRILRKDADILPCTPGAVMKILGESEEGFYGRNAVIIGHSAIVGKPLSLMLLNEMATTVVCHKATDERGQLEEYTRKADILVVAVGRSGFVQDRHIRPGATVIDVGINYVNGRIVGDVDMDSARKVAGAITPVPGGVGPVTVAILMRNVLRSCMRETKGGE